MFSEYLESTEVFPSLEAFYLNMALDFAKETTQQEEKPAYRTKNNIRHKDNGSRKTMQPVLHLPPHFRWLKIK
jgi:hypothetical protein